MSELCGAFSGTSVVAAFKNLSHGVRKEELWTSEPAESQKKEKYCFMVASNLLICTSDYTFRVLSQPPPGQSSSKAKFQLKITKLLIVPQTPPLR